MRMGRMVSDCAYFCQMFMHCSYFEKRRKSCIYDLHITYWVSSLDHRFCFEHYYQDDSVCFHLCDINDSHSIYLPNYSYDDVWVCRRERLLRAIKNILLPGCMETKNNVNVSSTSQQNLEWSYARNIFRSNNDFYNEKDMNQIGCVGVLFMSLLAVFNKI